MQCGYIKVIVLLTYVNICFLLVNVGKVTSQSQVSHMVYDRLLHDNMAPVNSNFYNLIFLMEGFRI